MTYNLTNFTNANDFLEIGVAVNNLTNGWYFSIVLLAAWLVLFSLLKKSSGTEGAMFGSVFMTFFLAAILWAVGLVGEYVLLASFVIMLVVGFFTAIKT